MNNINSILIEGKVSKNPVCIVNNDIDNLTAKLWCEFVIEVKKYYKVNNEYQQEESFFTVQAWSHLAERCNKYLKEGRGVRIIGRLKQYRWIDRDDKPKFRVVIIAQQIEFKPGFKESRRSGQT